MTWTSHKFGGTSLSDADAFRRVADIIAQSGPNRRVVTVSATAGTTDDLVALVSVAALGDGRYEQNLEATVQRHTALANEVLPDASDFIERLNSDRDDILDLLRATSLMGTGTDNALNVVSGYGELWSARLLAQLLESQGHSATWLDARTVLRVDTTSLVPITDWETSTELLEEWLAANDHEIVVVTGYIASDLAGVPVTLGRNGSDLSASIFGALLGADSIVIWTDVDGVMTADPSKVPGAHVIDNLSYDEAMELAYFGAKVLHPWTMSPAIRRSIPIVIRNSRHPHLPGTTIAHDADKTSAVKGLASVDDIALFNVEGTAMIGVPGISERLFGALREKGVSVVMISQASSEHSICFAAPQSDRARVEDALSGIFARERQFGQIKELSVTDSCSILAIVGEGMSGTPGIAARLFSALARVGVNVRAIAQGASERNITVVVDEAETTRALRAVHAGFYLSDQAISIGLIGAGQVGAAFLSQVEAQADTLRYELGIDLRVRAVANSRQMVLAEDRINLEGWRDTLEAGEPLDPEKFIRHVHTESVPHAVIIDCTADAGVAARYLQWMDAGIHVITPNKKANSVDLAYYRDVIAAGRTTRTHYLYETTVGAALPVIQTTRDLLRTGDRVHRIEGVLSGTLSYLFNNYDGSTPFSDLVTEARAAGFTEPDPRDDLSGMDVARKVVILGREIGLEVGLDDLDIKGLVPEDLEGGTVDEFLDRLSDYDDEMLYLLNQAQERGEVLRYVGVVDATEGCSVGLESYPAHHPFAGTAGTDNIIRFQTDRYNEAPLVVRGPGAGPDLTAGGIFADLLRLAHGLGAAV